MKGSIKVISEDKNSIELEFEGFDTSLLQLVAEKLNEKKEVEFASYKLEHPIVGKPKLYVRVKSGSPRKYLLDTLKEVKSEVESFKKEFEGIVE